ncbi:MAG: hypothetical protein PHF60_00495 [Candidatus ainarchaeum sp.]|nr:hypothetical protein [Candidatus ainarchaeum sp.]
MERQQIDALMKSGRYELVETHISWLLMDGKNVYKIKKPLKFSFLDFSTLEKRKMFCEEEVRLNRRLSPDVYLGVVTITLTPDEIVFGGNGEIVDYAVKMKRLDQKTMMDKSLREGKVTEADIKKLSVIVADFHKKAEVVKGDYGSPETVWRQIADLGAFRDAIEEACGFGAKVDFILEKSKSFIDANGALFRKRMADGKVKDCHGDLHSGNIFLQDGMRIVDCIEFNRDFRCIDVASDISFMAMDLDFFGKEDFSKLFVDEYVARAHDDGARTLLSLYKCYRANVRAKVAAIEWTQNKNKGSEERIRKYILLAERYAKLL